MQHVTIKTNNISISPADLLLKCGIIKSPKYANFLIDNSYIVIDGKTANNYNVIFKGQSGNISLPYYSGTFTVL